MNQLIPVTVVVPVKNEELNLGHCLDRLSRFQEVIVIDSSSTDNTPTIAKKKGANFVNFKWDGTYPKKRNWLLLTSPPTTEWVLFLDADEFVDEAFCDELAKTIADNKHDGYWLNYTVYFLGKRLKHGLPQRKLALFRVGQALYEKIDENGWSQLDMEIHEHPIVKGSVGEMSTPIDHRDYKGLDKFIDRHRDYAIWEAQRYELLMKDRSTSFENLTPRQTFKYRNITKWWYPWFYFALTYFVKGGILDGGAGLYYAFYKAWYFQTIRLIINENSVKNSGKHN